MAEIQRVLNHLREVYKTSQERAPIIDRRIEEQRKKELDIIKKTHANCPVGDFEKKKIDPNMITKAVNDGFADSNILNVIRCYLQNYLALPLDKLARNDKIRKYIKNITQIGEPSVDGDVFTGEIEEGKKIFVIKSLKLLSSKNKMNQLHEFFIGAFALNNLRSNIPNFMYVFGLFYCTPPYIDKFPGQEGKKALTICQNTNQDNRSPFIILENIPNAISFGDFAKKASIVDYMNVFVQLIFSIKIAHERYDFTHYDLHSGNVLIRPLNDYIYINYFDKNGKKIYLKTKYIATIIDFGRSHIKYSGEHFGYDLEEGIIYSNKSFPIVDLYKILGFTLFGASITRESKYYIGKKDSDLLKTGDIGNPELFIRLKDLIPKFASKENPIPQDGIMSFLAEARSLLYMMPYSSNFDIDIIDYYNKIIYPLFKKEINMFMTTTPSKNKIYGCNTLKNCSTYNKALDIYTVPRIPTNNVYEYYHTIMQNLAAVEPEKDIYKYGEKNYSSFMKRVIEDAHKNMVEINKMMPKQNMKVTLEMFSNDPSLSDRYRLYVNRVVKTIDYMTNVKIAENIKNVLAKLFDYKASIIIPAFNMTIPEIFDSNIEGLRNILKIVRTYLKDIKDFSEEAMRDRSLIKIHKLKWLREILGGIKHSVII